MTAQLAPFLLVVLVLTVTPGPDTVLVLRNGAAAGTRGAWWTALGCCTGIAVWAIAAVLGLAVVLTASPIAFTVVKIAGAGYLVYLGTMALVHSFRAPAEAPKQSAAAVTKDARLALYRQGLVSNLLNPKIAVLFVTLIPQFIEPGQPVLASTALLAAIFLIVALLWWRVFSLAVGRLGTLLARPRVRKAMDRITGVVLIAFGARIVLEQP
jgi:threonine/homoserine/homoserine lactone efflux protein